MVLKKIELNLPTIGGFVILTIILFILITLIVQQFVPTFRGVQLNVGLMLIFLVIAGITVTMILKREFAFNKSDILPLMITLAIIVAIIYFAPKILNGTMFEQSAIRLQSIFG